MKMGNIEKIEKAVAEYVEEGRQYRGVVRSMEDIVKNMMDELNDCDEDL